MNSTLKRARELYDEMVSRPKLKKKMTKKEALVYKRRAMEMLLDTFEEQLKEVDSSSAKCRLDILTSLRENAWSLNQWVKKKTKKG